MRALVRAALAQHEELDDPSFLSEAMVIMAKGRRAGVDQGSGGHILAVTPVDAFSP